MGEPATAPRASIVLPTLDGEQDLLELLPALARQDFRGGFEICAIDSDSRDRTRELLLAAGARVERIARSDFQHGSARNRCASMARGEFLVFLSQDVLPADEHFLEQLVAAFEDARVAGAYSRVLPHPHNDPLSMRTVLDLPEAGTGPSSSDLDGIPGVWWLEGRERATRLRFNNVASAIRTSVFERIPFPSVAFAEDFAWAARALTAGHRIAFAPRSVVHHAHRYTLAAAFERYRVDACFHREAHGWRVRPSLLSALRGLAYEVGEDLRFLARRGPGALARWAWRSPGLRGAQVLGQYVGSRGFGSRREPLVADLHF